jgi:gamma-glutamyl phosphate reductase
MMKAVVFENMDGDKLQESINRFLAQGKVYGQMAMTQSSNNMGYIIVTIVYEERPDITVPPRQIDPKL